MLTWNVAAVSANTVKEEDNIVFAKYIFGGDYLKAPAMVFVTLQ